MDSTQGCQVGAGKFQTTQQQVNNVYLKASGHGCLPFSSKRCDSGRVLRIKMDTLAGFYPEKDSKS